MRDKNVLIYLLSSREACYLLIDAGQMRQRRNEIEKSQM